MKTLKIVYILFTLSSCHSNAQITNAVNSRCTNEIKILVSPEEPEIGDFFVGNIFDYEKDGENYWEILPPQRSSFDVTTTTTIKGLFSNLLSAQEKSDFERIFENMSLTTEKSLTQAGLIQNKSVKIFGFISLIYKEKYYLITKITFANPNDFVAKEPVTVFISKNESGEMKFLNFVYEPSSSFLGGLPDEGLKKIMTELSGMNIENLEKLYHLANRNMVLNSNEKQFIESVAAVLSDDAGRYYTRTINLKRLMLKLADWRTEENYEMLNFFFSK